MANDNQKQGQPQRGNQSGAKKNRDRDGREGREGGQRQEQNNPQQGDTRNMPGDQAGQSRDNRRS
jgi:hypothetical protein